MGQTKESMSGAALSGVKKDPPKSLVAMPSNRRLDFFKGFAPQISMVLPEGSSLNAARIVSLAVQLTSDYKIANCDPKSIIGALMQSVILGFEPIPGLGLAAFIPYGDKLHFQIEYKGYLDLLYRTGLYDYVYGEVVREGDEFDYQRGTDPHIKHKPKEYNSGLTHAYAVGRLKGSQFPIFRVLTKAEVLQIRDNYSQAYRAKKKDSPWFGVRESEMWKKTAILQLQKDLPKSITIQKAVAIDEKSINMDDFDPKSHELDFSKYEMVEVTDTKTQSKASEPSPKPETTQKATRDMPNEKTEVLEPSEAFGDTEEVEAAAKENATDDYLPEIDPDDVPYGVDVAEKDVLNGTALGDEEAVAFANDTLLADAFGDVKGQRKAKYIREQFNMVPKETWAANGINNIGQFCKAHGAGALTSHDVTVGQYDTMLAEINKLK